MGGRCQVVRRVGSAAAIALAAAGCVHPHPLAVTQVKIAMPTIGCLAVLPFENLSDSDTQAGDAMADLVAIELMRSGRYNVLDRAEAGKILTARGIHLLPTSEGPTARGFGSALNVDAVLVGTVSEYREDPGVGATVRLVEVATGRELWLATVAAEEGGGEPVFQAAQEVASELASALVADAGERPAYAARPCWLTKTTLVNAMMGTSPIPFDPVPEATPTPAAPRRPLSASQRELLGTLRAQGSFVLKGADFVPGKAAMTATPPLLADLAAVLAAHPEIRLRIEAYLDPKDPEPGPLSERRAQVVMSALVESGAPAATLDARGMGGARPVGPSIVEALRRRNRRIEVTVLSGPS